MLMSGEKNPLHSYFLYTQIKKVPQLNNISMKCASIESSSYYLVIIKESGLSLQCSQRGNQKKTVFC